MLPASKSIKSTWPNRHESVFRLTSATSGGVGPPHRAEQDLGTSGSGGRTTPGIASTTKHAEQTDAEKHQARRLRDDIDGKDAGGHRPRPKVREEEDKAEKRRWCC